MNILTKYINRNLIYKKSPRLSDNLIISRDKKSTLSFIEITDNEYRFVFDKLDEDLKKTLIYIDKLSKSDNNIDIENLIWCGGGITIKYKYKNLK